jgi:hypothetical protein
MNPYILKEILYFCDIDTIEIMGMIFPTCLEIIRGIKNNIIKTSLEWKYKPKEKSLWGNYIYNVKKLVFKFSEFSYLDGHKWERLNYSYIFIKNEYKDKISNKLTDLFNINKNKHIISSYYEINAHHYYDEYRGYDYNSINQINKRIQGHHDWITITNDLLLECAVRLHHHENQDGYRRELITSYIKSDDYWNYYRKYRKI